MSKYLILKVKVLCFKSFILFLGQKHTLVLQASREISDLVITFPQILRLRRL